MKLLIAGLGSIGQRHARNLRQLYGDRVELLAYRVRNLPQVITEGMTIDGDRNVAETYGIQQFDSLETALAVGPLATFVCNPTAMHVETAEAALAAGSHVLIEKPLSHSREGIARLMALADRRRLVAAVGYQMRFHPALIALKQLLTDHIVGRVTSVRSEWHEYLPDAHPYEDYRQSYAARADLGGGVILCYIHEVDYLVWLFGSPTSIATRGGRLGDLEIDVEDTAVTTMTFGVEGRPVAVTLDQSFASRRRTRRCVVTGERGTIDVDLMAPSLIVSAVDGTVTRRDTFDGFRRNHLFVDELQHFFNAIDGRESRVATIADGAASLDVALAMKAALQAEQAVVPR